jgi:histidyl-tRNA synthetase
MPANSRPARGMRDFLPEDVRRRDYVIGVIEDVYRRYGFEPLETPALENIETLTGKYGEEGNKLIFKVLRRGEHEASGETDLALRYDLTVPLARLIAEYRGKLPKFFKRYQIQPVWRADRPARGRFREFYQCDVDAIGSRSAVIEAELCAAVADVLMRLGFDDFVIRLNHRGLLRGLLQNLGVPDTMQDGALVAIDKREKIGRSGVAQELAARGIPPDAARRLLDAFAPEEQGARQFGARGPNVEVVEWARRQVGGNPGGMEAIAELEGIVSLCAATSARDFVAIDPGLARGLSYYTGAIMEINVSDLAGSLGGGGRYDGLIGMFLGEDIPACGFSLGLERILVVMSERNMFPADVQKPSADVLLTLFEGEPIEDALRLAADLRAEGTSVEVYPEPDKLGKQFKYASSKGVPLVVIVGADERARGEVTIKNMTTGEQTSVLRSAAARWIAASRGENRPLNAPGAASPDSRIRNPGR